MEIREGTVSAAKHRAIMDAAMTRFLDRGYERTSMEDVAALAGVGKQTVYKHFSDKRRLFTDIVLGTTDQVDGMIRYVSGELAETTDVEHDLTTLARRLLTTLMDPRLIRLRRLVIASAAQFPELGRAWYEQGFERVLATLAERFAEIADRGLLQIPDAPRAAEHFVGMLLWIPLNRAMFTGDEAPLTQDQLERTADATVAAFLGAYLPR